MPRVNAVLQTITCFLQTFACLVAVLAANAAFADPFDHQWCRFTTSQFDLVTDIEPSSAQSIIELMGRFQLSINHYIGNDTLDLEDAKLPLKVFIFRSWRDFRATVKAGEFAGFMYPSMKENHLVIGPQPGNRLLGETALHEYTHFLIRDRIDVSYPLWYEEGLASLLSKLEFTNSGVVFGANADKRTVRGTLNQTRLQLAKVVDTRNVADWRHDKLSAFYDWSWLFVHYLNFGPEANVLQQQLSVYLADPERDFERAFDTEPKDLERVLRRYLRRPLPTRSQPLPERVANQKPVAIEPKCLSDAERNFELVATMMQHNPEGAIAVLDNLLEESYAPIETLVALSEAHERNQDTVNALQFAEAALSRDATHVSAKIQLANVLIGDCVFSREVECEDKWQRAIPLLRSAMRSDPQRYDAIYGLGLAYLHSGQAGDAINYLRIAYMKAPWSPHINFYLGEGYRLIGDKRAKRHLTNTRNWTSSDSWREIAESALEQLN